MSYVGAGLIPGIDYVIPYQPYGTSAGISELRRQGRRTITREVRVRFELVGVRGKVWINDGLTLGIDKMTRKLRQVRARTPKFGIAQTR